MIDSSAGVNQRGADALGARAPIREAGARRETARERRCGEDGEADHEDLGRPNLVGELATG